MSHIVDHSKLELTMQEDNSSLELLLVRLAREGTRRLHDNQGCSDDTVIPLVGLHSLQGDQTRIPVNTLVHPKATEVETTSTRLPPEYSLLIQRTKEKVEIVESRCAEVNLGNYLHHD
jgi:hypothetical protein